MLSPAEETEKPTETQQVRSSSRERSLTEKGQEMHEETVKKNEKVGVVKRMDACVALTAEICDLTSKRLENADGIFNDQLEKERMRMVHNKEEDESVFGNTETETAFSESLQESDSSSRATSRSSSRRADAEADLAVKIEQAKAMQQMREQQAKLNKLESELKLKEAQTLAEIKLKLDEEKTRLQQLQAENEVKVAAARVIAYNVYDGLENCEQEINHKVQYLGQNNEPQASLNIQAMPFQPSNAPCGVSRHQEEVSLTPGLASLLISNRLPIPEPTVHYR
ncbi:Hypothetical predicted protein [Pelobates cultripes]|uniref:Uncharacterized protein n=1 Tax=Pelobates cultripes TaxID=61616 RepID=A0AAD1VVP2_PELCU|nr:Hypothetical predicted protein [Pelobates cultripes]